MKVNAFEYVWAVQQIDARSGVEDAEGFLKELISNLEDDKELSSVRSGGFLVRRGEDNEVDVFIEAPYIGWAEMEVDTSG